MDVPYGYCHCGCGQKTTISNRSSKEKGWIKGEPRLFINNHHSRGENSYKWRGGKYKCMGYSMSKCAGHPKAGKRGYVFDHVLVAEKVLGRYLPENAVVHHVNGIRTDNRPENLIICENRAYHNLLHQRIDSLNACGDPSWRKCYICKEYDSPNNIRFFKGQTSGHHLKCYSSMRVNERKVKLNAAI